MDGVILELGTPVICPEPKDKPLFPFDVPQFLLLYLLSPLSGLEES